MKLRQGDFSEMPDIFYALNVGFSDTARQSATRVPTPDGSIWPLGGPGLSARDAVKAGILSGVKKRRRKSGAAVSIHRRLITDQRESDFLLFLRTLPSEDVRSVVVRGAELIWKHLRPLAGKAAVPHALVTDDGGIFMEWHSGRHHFDIEVLPHGSYDWFYRNRDTNDLAGGENYPLASFPADMLARFRLVTESAA